MLQLLAHVNMACAWQALGLHASAMQVTHALCFCVLPLLALSMCCDCATYILHHCMVQCTPYAKQWLAQDIMAAPVKVAIDESPLPSVP